MKTRPAKIKKSKAAPTASSPSAKIFTFGQGLKKLDYAVIVLTLILVTFGLGYQVLKPRTAAAVCDRPGNTRELIVKADTFNTSELKLTQCDIVQIINMGSEDYSLAFGTHQKLVVYPGFTEQTIKPNEFITLDAIQTGKYRLHDNLRNRASVELDIRAKL